MISWPLYSLMGPETGSCWKLPRDSHWSLAWLSRCPKGRNHGIVKVGKGSLDHGVQLSAWHCHHVTTELCPQVPPVHIFWTLPAMVTPPFPWAACSSAWQPFPWNYYFPKYPTWASPGATWGNFLLCFSRSLQSHRVTPGMALGAGRLFSLLPSSLHSVFESHGILHSAAVVVGVFN